MPEAPDDLVELRTVVNELEAGMIEGVLAEAGIPASHRTAKGVYLAMGMSSLHPSTVLVRRQDLARAEEVLAANRKDSVDLDWDEVDVGEPEDGIAEAIAARPESIPRAAQFGSRVLGRMLLAVPVAVLVGLILQRFLGATVVTLGLTLAVFVVTARALIVRDGVKVRGRARHDAAVFGRRE